MKQFSLSGFNFSKFLLFILIIIYSVFLFNIVKRSGSIDFFPQVIFYLAILTFLSYKKIDINIKKYLFIFLPFLCITLNEFFFHQNLAFEFVDKDIISHNYLIILPLIFLPFLIKKAKFTDYYFFHILLFINISSIFFNLYMNFTYDFNREILNEKIGSIILYDYSMISIALLTLILCFNYSKKYFYLTNFICTVNILLIIVHGSRGVWIALPIIGLLIFFSFYKTHLKPLILISSAGIVLLFSLYIFNPNISERINNFQQDTQLMSQSNYNNNTGQRVSMWLESIDQFKNAPFLGVGYTNLKTALYNRNHVEHPHAHNFFIHELAAHGILGFLGLLLSFLMPLYYFIIKKTEYSSTIRTAGITLVLYTLICGLTDYIFIGKFACLFYFILIMTLFSFNKISDADLAACK
ncbi:O-antigen ligase family protein [Acinetobacter sp.]|uniref:O-antigen ligase family protein n=1 Tax=Acinetobacter sp. TaxID=472 RepID=UPI0028A8A863|nr:O-antigen ligase family protein [Acinetobacter sp.]